MKTYEIDTTGRYNFHNSPPIQVIPKDIKITRDDWDDPITIGWLNMRQWRRIENHFCGIGSCSCSSGPRPFDYNADGVWIVLN